MSAKRSAFTLVELLVVIVIMLAVSAVAIRATAPALEGRRQREAARMIDVFISGARSRAMQSGTPAGVVFETGSAEPNACLSINYCEVPPAYSGDWTASTISMLGNGGFGSPIFPKGDSGWVNNVGPGDILVVNGTQYQLFAGEPFIDILPLGAPDGIYTPGEPFMDVNVSGAYNGPDAYLDANTGYFVLAGGAYPPANSSSITYAYFDPAFQSRTMSTTGLDPNGLQFVVPESGASTSQFRIIRRPVRNSGTSLQVPDGSCIDLGNSGVDAGLSTYQGAGPPLASLAPANKFPLMLTFQPNGDLDRLWFAGMPGRSPIAPVYFAVGKRELVPQSLTGQTQFTYQDLDTLWIGVTKHGGRVSVAQASPATGSTSQQQVYNSRKNARDGV